MGSLEGKTAVVTGATSGIGLEASVHLAERGAKVVVVARNEEKGRDAARTVASRTSRDDVGWACCDFSSQAKIRAFARDLLAKEPRIDVLVNNAGSMFTERALTEDGVERTFAVNHLGYFMTTLLLMPGLVKSSAARIVIVSSAMHRTAKLDFDDIGYENGGYDVFGAYKRSKLCNLLFAHALAKKLEGTNATVNALHPGTISTKLMSRGPAWTKPILPVVRLFMSSPKIGGERAAWVATSDDLRGKNGGYYEESAPATPSALARDDLAAKRLWDTSVERTGTDWVTAQ
jgi:NAD(P)-dependent dehydrogenase (short-subunit alcohol dehydrogenase family)